jgi:hypothetical protein
MFAKEKKEDLNQFYKSLLPMLWFLSCAEHQLFQKHQLF